MVMAEGPVVLHQVGARTALVGRCDDRATSYAPLLVRAGTIVIVPLDAPRRVRATRRSCADEAEVSALIDG